jgi:proteasome lid subunit RPN8/RPN11
MVAHAKRDAPNECCGLLVGHGRRVVAAVPMANIDARPRTGFRIDPAEHFAVRRVLRHIAPALDIIGAYHSHPAGPAAPSPRDIAEAHYPDFLFVIVGAGGRSIRGFRLAGGAAAPVRVTWERARTRHRTRR